jgi:hypothetical protein
MWIIYIPTVIFLKSLDRYINIAYKLEDIRVEMNQNPEYKLFFSELKRLHSSVSKEPFPFDKLFNFEESVSNSERSNEEAQDEIHASM